MGWQDVDIGDGLHVVVVVVGGGGGGGGVGFSQLDRSQEDGVAFSHDNCLNSCRLEKHDSGVRCK